MDSSDSKTSTYEVKKNGKVVARGKVTMIPYGGTRVTETRPYPQNGTVEKEKDKKNG